MTLFLALVSLNASAGAYKCTDESGKTTYQSKPCEEKNDAVEIDLKTGTVITHEMELKLQEMQQQKEQAEQDKRTEREKLIADTKIQSDLNQVYINNHWAQFSAFAIPPYTLENMPEIAVNYTYRLPEIERYRRLAAISVMEGGECGRVEASELSLKSTVDNLVFTIDCRTGRQIDINEQTLKQTYPDLTPTP